MADYYCQTSFLIPFDSKEEEKWLESKLALYSDFHCSQCKKSICGCDKRDEWNGGFEYERLDACPWLVDANHKPQPAFLVFEREYVNVDVIAELFSEFQEAFPKDEFLVAHFSYSCSKCEPDAFGGAALVAYHGRVKWLLPYVEVEDYVTEISNLSDFEQTLPME